MGSSGSLHEVLDLLQVSARPFLLEADILPAGLAVDLFGDVDAGELLLAGLVAHQVRVRREDEEFVLVSVNWRREWRGFEKVINILVMVNVEMKN